MKKQSKYLLYLPLLVILSGCKQKELSERNDEIDKEVGNVTYFAQDTIRHTPLIDSYYVDLTNSIDSSDGTEANIISVSSLSSSPSCNILKLDDKGFQVNAFEAKACTYQYVVGSKTEYNSKNTTKSLERSSHVGIATATVLSGDSSELLKPISATTSVNEPLDVFIKEELARYGYTIDIGFTLDTSSLVLPMASITGSLASASPGDDSVTYTPGSGFSGVERLIYSYTDGTNVLTGSIDIAVSTKINTAPNAQYFYYLHQGKYPVPYNQKVSINVKDYVSDSDGDELQLIDVFAYDANLSIPIDANNNGNNFDDTVFTVSSDLPGRHSITYVISDNKGGFGTGVIDLTIAPVYHSIIVGNTTPDLPKLFFTPPYTSRQAGLAGLHYVPGAIGDGTFSLNGISTATHDWPTANGICEARGGSLPTVNEMTKLYSNFENGKLFRIHNWPIDLSYWTLDRGSNINEFKTINMQNGSIASSVNSTNIYVACISRDSSTVEILGKDYLNVGSGQPSKVSPYLLEGTNSYGESSVIDNETIIWSSEINPSYLATFDAETATITTNPPSVDEDDVSGKATITGCLRTGVCDSKVVDLYGFVSSEVYGTPDEDSDMVEYVFGEGLMLLRCGNIVDAIGTTSGGMSGGTGGSLTYIPEASKITSINIIAGEFKFAQGKDILLKMTFKSSDGSSVSCGGIEDSTVNYYGAYVAPEGYKLYGFRAYSKGRTGYLEAIEFLSVPDSTNK